jgi:hypothetical protein
MVEHHSQHIHGRRWHLDRIAVISRDDDQPAAGQGAGQSG